MISIQEEREMQNRIQLTFDFDAEDKQEKLDWIENVILPMLEEDNG